MTLDLQEGTGHFVRSLAAIRDELGPASLAFFAPLSTPADAALDGSLAAACPDSAPLRARPPQARAGRRGGNGLGLPAVGRPR
jgi:hypothetical protein